MSIRPTIPQPPIVITNNGIVVPNPNNVIISAITPYRGTIPQSISADSAIAVSKLNTPVYSDFSFDEGSYTDDANNTIQVDGITFDTVLITVEQAKNIVTTQISGRDGTIKEYIGLDDYRITVQGLITGDNGEYPEVNVKTLIGVLTAPVPINVTSKFLTFFNIKSVVVADYSLPQVEGSNSIQPFAITLLSDTTIDYVIM
jgi:hypothetical protein